MKNKKKRPMEKKPSMEKAPKGRSPAKRATQHLKHLYRRSSDSPSLKSYARTMRTEKGLAGELARDWLKRKGLE